MPLFRVHTHDVGADPRFHRHAGDARFFLREPGEPWDVIISEPSNPWITGVSNLFTREYFRDVKGRLAPDGIFCQWAQLYELSPANVKTTGFPVTPAAAMPVVNGCRKQDRKSVV